MLYTSESVVLPPMTKRRVYLQAPEEVVKRGDQGIIVPVFQEAVAKSMHHVVEPGAVKPQMLKAKFLSRCGTRRANKWCCQRSHWLQG
jgi:hypothetical protein